MDAPYLYTFEHPTTVVLAGPTKCGKTQFLVRALRENRFQPNSERIVWVFGEWQPAYEELARDMPCIQFIKGFSPELYQSFDARVRNMLILDDQMENKAAKRRGQDSVVKFFTQGSHHRNLTVVYIVQNMYNKDEVMRTVSLNTHYMILFKNWRDQSQITTLARQMFGEKFRFLEEAFKHATQVPYGHMVIDCRPNGDDRLRVLSQVFDDPTAYVPREDAYYMYQKMRQHAEDN